MQKHEIDSATTTQLATRIPKGLHHRIKIAAFAADVTLRDWVAEALATYLAKVEAAGPSRKATDNAPA